MFYRAGPTLRLAGWDGGGGRKIRFEDETNVLVSKGVYRDAAAPDSYWKTVD